MKKNNKNNKGFSLVELIIVIAIMAILIGVLAPQYLKFVERSRKSTDRQNVDEIVRAIEIYAADPDAEYPAASGSVTIKTTSQTAAVAGSNDFIDAALDEAGIKDVVLKSKQWLNTTSGSTTDTVIITITVTDGVVSATADAKDSSNVNILE